MCRLCSLQNAGAQSQTTASATNANGTGEAVTIDLPTVLRLANARNLDVQIARQKLAEARAVHESSVSRFLPWLAPGVVWRRHDNVLQDVTGNMLDVHKESYAPGVTINAAVDLGDATYNSLATKQNARAATHAVEAQRQDSILAAIQGYYDLVKAQGRIGVAREAQAIARNLEAQLINAVQAGIAYKGDELRARIQTGQTELAVRQAVEEQRNAAARLAQVLHLDSTVELAARENELVPIVLVASNTTAIPLIEQALRQRPELRQNQALVSAASSTKKGALYGPLIPTLGGQAYLGGLGGGPDNGPSRFGDSEDYSAFVFWRIGPGGLFDLGRNHQATSQLETARLNGAKIQDGIIREVVEAVTRYQSLAAQLDMSQRTMAVAVEAEQLAEQRKAFAVGVVLEDIQTQQDLARARNEFVGIVTEYNKAQYALQRAVGTELFQSESPQRTPESSSAADAGNSAKK